MSKAPVVKKKKKKRIFVLAGVGAFLLIFAASAEFTSHSKFCSTCHYMKPFYQSWETSSHKDIECNVCHYPPGLRSKLRAKVEGLLQVGRYWTKLYLKSKPWAEISDEACLRVGCHDKRLLQGLDKFQKIVFDHKIHLEDLQRGKQLRCTSCHSQIVQGEHITVTESSCFICHFKKSEHYPQIGECSHCHHREELTSEKTSRFNHSSVFDKGFECNKCHSQIIMGDGAVPRENCYKCHWETDRLNKYEETDLMHSTHITSHKIECNQCHLEIQHKIVKDIETIADCQACHSGFHKAQKILYEGTGGKGVPHTIPNIMLEKGLSCKGCHIFHEEKGGELLKSETFTSREMACESCHGKGFSRILKDWEIATEKRLSEINKIYERTRREINQAGKEAREKALRNLEDARFNIDIVERGKSVHNMTYSLELLRASFASLEEALRLADSSFTPQRFLDAAQAIPTQCSNCHSGIEEINRQVFGLDFPHKKHLAEQKMNCSACHSNARTHGEFIATKQSCATCHHQDPKKDCGQCHVLQKTVYEGGELHGDSVPRDMMAEAGVGCSDCHINNKKQIFRSDSTKCAECHEEEYKSMFNEWQSSTKQLMSSLSILLREKKKLSLTADERAQLQSIEKTLGKIKLDGSSGVHNSIFHEEILTKLIKHIKSLGTNQGHG